MMRALACMAALAIACGGSRAVKPDAQPPAQAAAAAPEPVPVRRPKPVQPRMKIIVNDVVLAQLRHLTGTPGARRHMRDALHHRLRHLSAVHAALSAEGLPLELDAIPLVETGYENIDGGKNGAGLWQFIRATATHFGLRVTDAVDERMNPRLETAAAARYLRELHDELDDWPLVLAAYSQGITHLRAVMRREKTRDVWTLIRRGAIGVYAARVMAAALLVQDPSPAGV
jgi:membrane-bound lytic murein transglycosylase D